MSTLAPEFVYLCGMVSGITFGLLIWASHKFTKMIEADQK